MKAVSRRIRVATPLADLWHPGELDWVHHHGRDRGPDTTIWTDAEGPAGWVFVDGERRSADVALRPDLRATAAEETVIALVEEHLGAGPVTLHAWEGDAARRALLAGRGYEPAGPDFQTFVCDLTAAGFVPDLPAGFRLLDAVTEEWVAERAECHRRAFDRSTMTPDGYAAFRRAPGYDPEMDVAVVADDGRLVAYAMAWADDETRTGQLEPVGTRPHFWRRGLGRVANREALRRLRARGIRVAGVNTWADNEGNLAFYRSCGFEPGPTIDRWVRAT